MSVVGIPASNLSLAKSITLPGYAAAVAASNRRRGQGLGAANMAFQTMLRGDVFDASSIPLHRSLAAVLYKVPGLQGLGDGEIDYDFVNSLPTVGVTPATRQEVIDFLTTPDPPIASSSPPDSSDGSGSWWSDVLKTFAGPLAMGVGGRIAGVNPWAKPNVNPVGAMSTTTKVVLAGGALLVGAFVVSKLAKKS